MSLIGALNIGKSALAVQQAALQVTGQNISNAGNADYTRQSTSIVAAPDHQYAPGIFIGTGIDLAGISRQIDEALEGRLRSSISDSSAAQTSADWLGRVESTFNELGDSDLSTQMSNFFNSWSNLANSPGDSSLRQVVLQNGETLSASFTSLRTDLQGRDNDVDIQITGLAGQANNLAQQVADLNGQITVSEVATGGTANGLRDQRDAALKQLSHLVGIKTTTGDGSNINVYIGSQPLVIGTQNNGIALQKTQVNNELVSTVVFKNTGADMEPTTGQIGALISSKTQYIDKAIHDIDGLATNLIFELNKVHASGQGTVGFSSVTASNQVIDQTVALNDAKSGLQYQPQTGSFVIHLRQKDGTETASALVHVDLDGLNGDDTTLNSLTTALNSAIPGVTAQVQGGLLTIKTTDPNQQITFSQDSSNVLASLGINTFFTGTDASNIAVNATVINNTANIAAATTGDATDNQTALAIAKLAGNKLAALGGTSLNDTYDAMVNRVAVAVSTAKSNATAANTINQTLEAQRESLSGVSMDEEAVNLMQQQRAFQGAARFVTAVDDMMKTILAMAT